MSTERANRVDGPDGVHQDLTAEIELSLRGIAATFAMGCAVSRSPEAAAELARMWTQLADDVAAGRLAELDLIEAAASSGKAIDLNRTDTEGAVQ